MISLKKVLGVCSTFKWWWFHSRTSPTDGDINLTTREGTIETLPSGNELVRTHQHLVIAKGANGEMAPAILDMKKTQLKVSRRWNTLKNGIRLPSGKPMPLYGTAWNLQQFPRVMIKGHGITTNLIVLRKSQKRYKI